jgi:hypothetical protein
MRNIGLFVILKKIFYQMVFNYALLVIKTYIFAAVLAW